MTTLAGTAGTRGNADGVGAAARFASTSGIATDGNGNIYVGDLYNYAIRKITPSGLVSTLAGATLAYGSSDGIGADARITYPNSLATDRAGNVYMTEVYNHAVRKISPTGVVSTLAGSVSASGSSDGISAAAQFNGPQGIAVDGTGNVYIADSNNHTIRKITTTGDVSTLAGAAGMRGNADGTGAAARFNYPGGLAVDAVGNVYVAEYLNHAVRKVTPAGVVSTLVQVMKLNEPAFTRSPPSPGDRITPFNLAIFGSTLYITMLNGVAVVNNLP